MIATRSLLAVMVCTVSCSPALRACQGLPRQFYARPLLPERRATGAPTAAMRLRGGDASVLETAANIFTDIVPAGMLPVSMAVTISMAAAPPMLAHPLVVSLVFGFALLAHRTLVLIAEAIDASGVAPSLTEVWGGSSALGGARTVWLRACCERSMEQSMPEGLFVLVETLLRYALNTRCALLYSMLVFPFSPTPTRPRAAAGRGPAAYKQKKHMSPRAAARGARGGGGGGGWGRTPSFCPLPRWRWACDPSTCT